MTDRKYTEAYRSIKAPSSLADKILNTHVNKKSFNVKGLISAVACVIIMASIFPAYVSLTEPSVSASTSTPMAARSIGLQIPLELSLERNSLLTVSHGILEGYNGERVNGDITVIWNVDTAVYEDYTLTVKDNLKSTVYSLSYNENNDSFTIIKN